MLSQQQLQEAAAVSGFQLESYEKVHVLVGVLGAVRSHPFLGPRMALKGGTALNLFVLDLPRLSVDIDLNYVGGTERETMLAERPRIEQALTQVAGRLGLTVKRVPVEHAGGKWRFTYRTALGRQGNIEVDVNFMLRTPLWPPMPKDSHPIGSEKARQILILNEHELAAGKLAALFARSASRDVFDTRELLRRPGLDSAKLRLGFVIYGGANRKDWRAFTVDNVLTTANDVYTQLVPMLRSDMRPTKADIAHWTDSLIRETRDLIAALLPLKTHELEFLRRLNDDGEIEPGLLTSETSMQTIIQNHPGLKWKALNVRKQLGAATGSVESD